MSVSNIRNRATAGYTIDQTILIVAIIAILVTLIIITIGWQLINRTSGAKLAAQLRQVEDANGQFFSANRIWPHQSYGSPSAANNMRALSGGVTYTSGLVATTKNYLPGLRDNGTNVVHNFTSGGTVTMNNVTTPFAQLQGTYLVVQFTGVPMSEAAEAELAIDAGRNGTANYTAGRFVATTATDCLVGTAITAPAATATTVNVCYAANNID